MGNPTQPTNGEAVRSIACSAFVELQPGTKLQKSDQVRWDGEWRDLCIDFAGIEYREERGWPVWYPTTTKGIRYRRPNAKDEPQREVQPNAN